MLYQHTQCKYILTVSILKHYSFSHLLTFWLLADSVVKIKRVFDDFLSLTTKWFVKGVIIQTLLLMFTFIFKYLFWYSVNLICYKNTQRIPKSLASHCQLIRESLKTSSGNFMKQKVCLELLSYACSFKVQIYVSKHWRSQNEVLVCSWNVKRFWGNILNIMSEIWLISNHKKSCSLLRCYLFRNLILVSKSHEMNTEE